MLLDSGEVDGSMVDLVIVIVDLSVVKEVLGTCVCKVDFAAVAV